jgi:DNA-binding transcriptional regulator GbsR (MarR family)
MKPPKSHKTIIEKLAFNPPLTIYRLNKITGHSTSTLHAAVKKLVSNRLVKKHKKGFTLSFIGLTKYLATHFADPQFEVKQTKQIIKKYATLDNYPLLTLHSHFEQWLGNQYYEHLISTSYLVNHIFESKIHLVYIKAPKPIKRGEKIPIRLLKPSLEQEEQQWKHKFAITFFNLNQPKPKTKPKPPKNQKIQTFLKQTFKQEIKKKKQEIQKLKKTLQQLTHTKQNLIEPK